MASILAQCIGLNDGGPVPPHIAAALLERRTPLARSEARILVLDYIGLSREQICEYLQVSSETVRTYWKRIYRKTACHSRAEVHVLLETIIRNELSVGNGEQMPPPQLPQLLP
jgi:DNA-binding CsgD family transcriptional regulator